MIIEYIKDVKTELGHVNWPTTNHTVAFTMVVIGISVLVAVYLGFFDFLFTRLLAFLIGN